MTQSDQPKPEPSAWTKMVEANPDHSHWYIERFRQMAAAGDDLAGEARLVDALVRPGAHILDAGSGPGRVGGYLARRGHRVVGVDVDPVLIAAATEDHPQATWLVQDLAELDLAGAGVTEPFDAIVAAGNVMTFLAPSTRREVLRRLGAHLASDGRAAIGFGAGRGYPLEEFLDDARAGGLVPEVLLSTWDLRPFEENADFLVAVLGRATPRHRSPGAD
ncbi:MAG TPA: class I SAM-dependent methyltransferase [Actinomycetaceae bacterium]|nr:class I SAM-dependent methyltransferase [Actinomycetaceae bacterium]